MGNLCSWCLKDQDQLQSNGITTGLTNSERSFVPSENDERTPLIGKTDHQNHTSIPTNSYLDESSTFAPFPPSEIQHDTKTQTIPQNETAETKMAFIVEGMLSKLIDVGNNGTNISSTNSNTNEFNSQNEHLKHLLIQSLSSNKIFVLPDAGLNNLPSLLSGRPISSETCHFIAQTAGDLSHLLIDEIKIIHKEDLVVIFE